MADHELIRTKMARLQQLRQYQAQYGAHTPYPITVEINQLERELGQLLRTEQPQKSTKAKKHRKRKAKKKTAPAPWELWRMSRSTLDIIAAITFLGLLILLSSILIVGYISSTGGFTSASAEIAAGPPGVSTLRPTFTPTSEAATVPSPQPVIEAGNAEELVVTVPAADSYLPTPSEATAVPTLVPTVTPRVIALPTMPPQPTATPLPTRAPPTPIPVRISQPATPTSPPPPPTQPPSPTYPFVVTEQGNRFFQKTAYHAIIIYVAVVSEGNIPMGGYKVVGDHVPSGKHVESALSTWDWSVTNCLDCDYIKQGNLKFEPGPFEDGTWNIYLADEGGQRLSDTVAFSYATDSEQWVWDFVIFQRRG